MDGLDSPTLVGGSCGSPDCRMRFEVEGWRVWDGFGLGFWVLDLGLGLSVLPFRVWGLGFWVGV